MDCKKVFEKIVDETEKYIVENNLKAMVLGISGGIDSTIVAVACHKVSERTGIPLIGRSLPTKYNKEGEITTADLVGKAFCDDYKVVNLNKIYHTYLAEIMLNETGNIDGDMDFFGEIVDVKWEGFQTPLANGNIQARLRMIYLYNLAGLNKGLVMDTDNLSEHYLGYYTIHGDNCDFTPIGDLWKNEVYELGQWLYSHYLNGVFVKDHEKAEAICKSMNLVPTAGLGITNSDLEEIGAKSYDDVDKILMNYLAFKDSAEWKDVVYASLCSDFSQNVVDSVINRHINSSFKRKQYPIRVSLRNTPFSCVNI